jgi:Lamin Tail Domain/Secretion system C-terminal sorting domain
MKKIILLFSLVIVAAFVNAQVTEDFETTPLTGWTFYQTDVSDPGFVQTSLRANNGTYSFFHDDNNLTAVSTSWMVSPVFSCQASSMLKFWYNQNYTGFSYDYSGVWISTASNDPITNPGDFVELMELNASAPGGFSEDTWTEFTQSLTAYAASNIYIAFKYTGDYAHELWIDDFVLMTPQPFDFTVNAAIDYGVAPVGADYSFLVEISNLGTSNDTFDLALSGNTWTSVIRDKSDVSTISSLPVITGAVDTFLVKVSVPGTASLGDMDSVMYSVTSQGNSAVGTGKLYTNAYAPIPAPYTETLEENSPYRDLAWQINNTSPTWNLSIGTSWPSGYDAHGGDLLVYFNSWSVTSGVARVYAWYDLSATTNTELRYWMFKDDGSSSSEDSVQAQISTDGMVWTNIGTSEMRYDASGDAWHEIILDISAYDGDSIWIGLEGGSDYGQDIHIDDIYVGPKPPADLVITEIMYNPPEAFTDSLEFFEVYNNSIYTTDVSGFEVGYASSGSEYIAAGTMVAPGEYLVFATDSAAFEGFYGFAPISWTVTTGLGNGGNDIWIKDAAGNMIDTVEWDNSSPWPTQAAGNGTSIVLCDNTLDNNIGSSWNYSTMYVDTNAVGDTIWASPGVMDSTCYVIDIAFNNPLAGSGLFFSACDMPSPTTIELELINAGTLPLLTGDSIFLSYQIDANPVVFDTLVLTADFDAGSTESFIFSQTVDMSVDGDYDFVLTLNTEDDVNLLNDTSSGIISNFVVDVNLPGFNDTLYTAAYPLTIDAGATTSGGYAYSNWDWSTMETTQTIAVSTDGWYYVTVTTATDSMGSQCTAIDSVYVVLGTGVSEYEIVMNVYPNPNSGTFTVVFDGNTNGTVLTIMDIKGQIIREEELSGDAVKQIDMSAEPKGIYFIRVMNEHSIKVERVIVQ